MFPHLFAMKWWESVNYELEWANLIQMTITSTTVGKNPLEEME